MDAAEYIDTPAALSCPYRQAHMALASSVYECRTSGAVPPLASADPAAFTQAHDNTYLSYSRNAIISTVAGGALVQHHKAEGKPPLAGAGLLLMGGMFMYVGSGLYVYQVAKLARPMRLGAGSVLFKVLNACWPVALWTISLACLLDEYPRWLLEGLRNVESHLPSVPQHGQQAACPGSGRAGPPTARGALSREHDGALGGRAEPWPLGRRRASLEPRHSAAAPHRRSRLVWPLCGPSAVLLSQVLHASLFFDPPALYPVCKLLQGVLSHELERLRTTRRHAEGNWSMTKPHRAPLNDLDVASIVARRIERLEYIEAELKVTAPPCTAMGVSLYDQGRPSLLLRAPLYYYG